MSEASSSPSSSSSPGSSRRLHVNVVTPEGSAFQGEASQVVVPGHDGEVAFLPGHAAFLGALGLGALRVTRPDGQVLRWFLSGGVAQVVDGRVRILAERVVPEAEIQAATAREEIASALKSLPTTDEAFEARDQALDAARARLRMVGGASSAD